MLNRIIIQGRLTKDPEVKTTQNQSEVCSFSIACDRNFSGQNGQKQTDFINCVAWKQKATFLGNYFHKGDLILLSGSLQSRQYQDKNGNNRTVFEVLVDEIDFCGSRQQGNAPQASQPQVEPASPDFVSDDGNLPFEV